MYKNYFTNQSYQGTNIAILSMSGVQPNEPLATFIQWKKGGYKVKKGAKGIHLTAFVEVEDELSRKKVPRHFCVFPMMSVEKVEEKITEENK